VRSGGVDARGRGKVVSKRQKKWYSKGMEKEKKSRKETTMKENMGKLLLDLGKLVVGGIIIGGILRGEVLQIILIASGSVVALIFFIFGLFWTAKEKQENKE